MATATARSVKKHAKRKAVVSLCAVSKNMSDQKTPLDVVLHVLDVEVSERWIGGCNFGGASLQRGRQQLNGFVPLTHTLFAFTELLLGFLQVSGALKSCGTILDTLNGWFAAHLLDALLHCTRRTAPPKRSKKPAKSPDWRTDVWR